MGQCFLLERGDKPVKRVDVEMGEGEGVLLFLLLYSSIQSHLLCVGGKYGIPLLLFGSSVF